MVCDYCHATVARTVSVIEDDGTVVSLCRDCLADARYCASGGRIPQEDA